MSNIPVATSDVTAPAFVFATFPASCCEGYQGEKGFEANHALASFSLCSWVWS